MTNGQRATVRIGLGLVGLGVLAVPVVAVSTSGAATGDPLWTALRLAALEAFSLVFVNIVTGAFRPLLTKALRPVVLQRLHATTGAIGLALAFGHGVMVLVYGLMGYDRPFLWVGPVMVAGLAVAIGVALERQRLRGSWRWIHRLNYLVFAAALVHSSKLGFELSTFSWLRVWFYVCAGVVACGLIYRLAGLPRRSLKRPA